MSHGAARSWLNHGGCTCGMGCPGKGAAVMPTQPWTCQTIPTGSPPTSPPLGGLQKTAPLLPPASPPSQGLGALSCCGGCGWKEALSISGAESLFFI